MALPMILTAATSITANSTRKTKNVIITDPGSILETAAFRGRRS